MGALEDVDRLAAWSPWLPFAEAVAGAPLVPGVYMARIGTAGEVVYVGMAGERSGSGKPQGLRGRLRVYLSGKGAVSGLGEAAMDRALAHPAFLRERLAEVEAGQPRRAKLWAAEAITFADLHLRYATTEDKASALALEAAVLETLRDADLWNRAR